MDFNTLLIVILGVVWGSFLTTVIWRVDNLPSIFRSRSRCTSCSEKIAWYDLIPILSFVMLRGRCRKCHKSLSFIYPFVEIISGIIFYLVYSLYAISWPSLLLVVIFSLFIVILGHDAIFMVVDDKVVYIAIALVVVYNVVVLHDHLAWVDLLKSGGLGLFIGIAIPATLVIVSKGRWMGEGDISLGALMGVFLGFPNIIVAYVLAFALGSVAGLALIAFGRKKIRDPLPFGPFLVPSTVVVFFWGEQIVNWYLKIAFLGG